MPVRPRRRPLRVAVALLALLLGLVLGQLPGSARAATTTTAVTVDGNATGRTFDGVGAISGGGGNSRSMRIQTRSPRAT